jgi:YcxB-like protein
LPTINEMSIREQFARLADDEHERRIQLIAVGVEVQHKRGTNMIRWSAILRIAVTPTHLFLYDGPTSAVFVPKRAFETDQEFAEFTRFATESREVAMAAEGKTDTRIVASKKSTL